MLMTLYFFKYATDVLLVSPGVLGSLMAASRLWDAVSDPLAGYLSDRTTSKLGRRRPWMLAGALLLGIALVVLWTPPAGLVGRSLAIWVGVGLFAFYTAYTVFSVPYGALGAELSQSYHDRTRLFAYRTTMGGVGGLLALGGFYLLLQAESPETSMLGLSSRDVAAFVSIVCLAIVSGTILFLVVRTRERPEYLEKGPGRIFGAFADVFRNHHSRRLLYVFTVQTFATVSLGLLGAYVFQYVMKVPSELAALFVGAFALSMAAAIPVWVRVSHRVGKHRAWTWTLWALAVGYSGVYFLMRTEVSLTENPLLLAIACSYAGMLGAVSACGYVVAPSIKADVIDYDELRTGERKEGAYLAAWAFVEKSSGALATALLGAVLDFAGYVPGAEQSESTRTAIVVLMSLVPAAGFVSAAIIFRRFDLDEREHARIRAELDRRARLLGSD